MSIKNLEPKTLWSHFADLNAVPRPSKKEERVIKFMMDFGNSLGLETLKDAIGNVIIKKKATPGMEDRKMIIMQSHIDMVHQKNSDTVFDFDTQGIEMIIDGDWVRANGTTLGADNGIGVAAIMAILSSTDIPHPAVEAMFTIDEETGMTGAMELDPSNFDGEILLNLDTEDDDEISIGCAGGVDSNSSLNYTEVDLWEFAAVFEVKINGLLGGHSGMDIDKERGNANKLMNRLLQKLMVIKGFQLISIDGGSLRNAIPRESVATFAINHDFEGMLEVEFAAMSLLLKNEFISIEKEMNLTLKPVISHGNKAVSPEDLQKIIRSIYSTHNGVFRMSPDIKGLVETSGSLARVIVKDGSFITQSLLRSSVESTKTDIANSVRAGFEAVGCEVVQDGDYPGWQPNKDSEILTILHELYVSKYNEEPQIKACHAGLECGLLLKHLPEVDMISFGPNIRAAHSPDEKVQISSVQKFWDYLLEVLVLIPKKSA
ncbi:aminoacyl-histidine dipeptidase [bacterium]|nr:aminoacyl-histidine dipeptidase [bacterium]